MLHAGGAILELNSDAYLTLQTWLENGATENGLKPPTPAQTGNGTCSTAIPSGFSTTTLDDEPEVRRRARQVQERRAADPEAARLHVVELSRRAAVGLLHHVRRRRRRARVQLHAGVVVREHARSTTRRSCACRSRSRRGGRGHTGGDQFAEHRRRRLTTTIRDWASSVGLLDFANGDPVKQYFKDNVQPILIARGCSVPGVSLADGDQRLQAALGHAGLLLGARAREELRAAAQRLHGDGVPRLAARSRDRQGAADRRLRASTTVGGISHRGGPVLETPGFAADPAGTTIAPDDARTVRPRRRARRRSASSRSGSTWSARRSARRSTSMNMNDTIPIVYVDRPAGQARGPARVRHVPGRRRSARRHRQVRRRLRPQLTVDNATQASLIAGCAASARPPTSGARASRTMATPSRSRVARRAAAGWRIYTVSIATKTCTPVSDRRRPARSPTSIRRGRRTARTSCSRRRAARPARRPRPACSRARSPICGACRCRAARPSR